MATIREVSEKIRDHLTQQRARATSGVVGGSCMYLGPDGNKCAVGCLIPDGQYDAAFEGSAIGMWGRPSVDRLRKLLSEHYGLDFTRGTALTILTDWQRYHDSEGYATWIEHDALDWSPDAVHGRIMHKYGVA